MSINSMRATVFFTLFLVLFSSIATVGDTISAAVDSTSSNAHLHRNLIVGNLVCGTVTYFYLEDTWGTPNGRFHLKDDTDDNLNLTDEISHLFVGYKLTEGFFWLFRILKMQPDKIEKYAALEAALITTLVEFPLDAFNPDQGLGITDLILNYAGIGFAMLKKRHPNNFDLKFSLKKSPTEFDNKFLASKNKEFDNYIWWGVWKPRYLWLGLGYSTNHDIGDVESEYYLGIGTTAYDLLHCVASGLADKIKVLDSFFINLRVRL